MLPAAAVTVGHMLTLLARWALFILGLAAVSIGVGLVVGSQTGPGTWSMLEVGLVRRTGMPLSVTVAALQVLALAGVRAAGGQVSPAGVVAAILLGPAVGSAVDLAMAAGHVGGVPLLAGAVLIGVGAGTYIGAGLGEVPYDLVYRAVAGRTGVGLVQVRWTVDLAVLVLATMLGSSAGVGTVTSVLVVGWLAPRTADRVRGLLHRPAAAAAGRPITVP